jgi:predicted small metal-binding protein
LTGPNPILPNPEFTVNCLMCNHSSFAATADTLEELVKIVNIHIREAREKNYETHKEYFKNYADAEAEMPGLLHHDNTRAILESKLFKWSIAKLAPFDKILEVEKIPPFPRAVIEKKH